MISQQPGGYEGLSVFYGDLHNHCGLSYGHGSLADALHNARLQLDIASVTVHAVWPDLPTDDPDLRYLVDYHEKGFRKAEEAWPSYLAAMEDANEDGRFVTFPSFEWHSMRYGDHCVYYRDGEGGAEARPIVQAEDLRALRSSVRGLDTPCFVIPHHMGYRQGYRGANWAAFREELSPVAEVYSFHGLSVGSEGPYPYLHSMGPRHEQSTAQFGWEQGHVFGVIGSTDHHNAFPGSYGYGRLAVWAQELSRAEIWSAIAQRRTYAVTGDRIDVAFAVNGRPLGAVQEADEERWIEVDVAGSGSIDYVDVLHNNVPIHRESRFPQLVNSGVFTTHLEMGWGERTEETPWDVELRVVDGRLLGVEPRFRGFGPTDSPPDGAEYASYACEQTGANRVRFHTKTRQNPSPAVVATEGMALVIQGDSETRLELVVNGRDMVQPLSELLTGTRTVYLGGFVSPALCFHRAVPQAESSFRFAFLHRSRSPQRDWYTVHVRQRNDQWAWTSPIWVAGKGE